MGISWILFNQDSGPNSVEKRVRFSPVMGRQSDETSGLPGDAADLSRGQPVERVQRRLDEQRRQFGVPPALDRLAEIPYHGPAILSGVLLQKFDKEDSVPQAFQAVQPLEYVHAMAAAADTRGSGQVLNHDERRHSATPSPPGPFGNQALVKGRILLRHAASRKSFLGPGPDATAIQGETADHLSGKFLHRFGRVARYALVDYL